MGSKSTMTRKDNKKSRITKCVCCNKGRVESQMLRVDLNFCRKCYLSRKKELFELDINLQGEGEINQITSQIFLGNNDCAKSKDMLKSRGITHVLVCGYFLHEYFPEDFTYKTIEIEDHENEIILTYLIDCIEFIESSQKVFVHCRAGISRSSSIVIGYLMYSDKISYEEAKNYVLSKRNSIAPNGGFEKQLKEFQDIKTICNYNKSVIKTFIENFK